MTHEKDFSVQEKLKATLNLPHTDFPIRPNAKNDDPAMISRWEGENLYQKASQVHEGAPKYILHDGPPYANGNIHLGHAYNKILKDTLTKAYRMSGHHVPVIPGWDCHGLPIELKVVQQQSGLSPLEIKKACRAYAQQWIDIQRQEFKRLGVVMEWDKPYITMDFGYEADIMHAFGKIVEKGFIERKNKTVAWCFSCETTLASAEIEYQDRKDPSVYVLFPLTPETVTQLLPEVGDKTVSLLVWTTTPWTLPLNRAVAVKPNAQYRLMRFGEHYVIVGSHLAETIGTTTGLDHEQIKKFSSDLLHTARVQHPFIESLTVPVIYDDGVSIEEGTACVHIAPGCGPTDYELGVKNNLEIYSPITANGKYTDAILPAELAGMSVTDGQIWVIKKLAALGRLFYKSSLRHSYPHCWRCHNGLIFRATPQWFFDLQHDNIQEKALKTVEDIKYLPERGVNFLRATVGSRWEWCLSRQRSWGVPIPALLCNVCDKAFINAALVERVAQKVAQEGIEYWDTVPVEELVADVTCCGKQDFRKERDIVDVWFESGISHYAVLYRNPAQQFPADVYLEGVDQYRAWFQSSLLTALALEGQAPMKKIISHGFTVDEHGRKMSKSIGNVVSPQQIIDQLGTDGLRLWVTSIGNDGDAVVSETLLKNVSEVFRKVRNTCRFLLQNLYDFDKDKDAIATEELPYLDKVTLLQLVEFNKLVLREYLAGNFTAVFHHLADYCATHLSSLYLDIIKDRLYVEKADGYKRRSAQTVVWYLLDTLTRLVAPILSFTAEQLSDHYQKNKTDSIHLQKFAEFKEHESLELATKSLLYWEMLLAIRATVLKAIELQREQGLVKHSLEAAVILHIPRTYEQHEMFVNFLDLLQYTKQDVQEFFKEFFIVSSVQFVTEQQPGRVEQNTCLVVEVTHAPGTKCPRCWNWEETEHEYGLCKRCAAIVGQL
jgi:isoleucyl-tRNA synthetase